MKYLTHIITDTERIRDPEGRDYPDLASAQRDVERAIRRLTADELLAERPLPLNWRAQICNTEDVVQSTVTFASVVLGKHAGDHAFPAVAHPEAIQAAIDIIIKTRAVKVGISSGLEDLRTQLRALAHMNAALGRGH